MTGAGSEPGAGSASPPAHWFEPLAEHMGPAYLRYSFTRGTRQEVAFLLDEVALGAGATIVDVGCGPGRHAHALAERGCRVVGVDISQRFATLAAANAPAGAGFVRGDARALPLASASVDAAISLCQGGFGLVDGDADAPAPERGGNPGILTEIARVLRPGGVAVVSAFSAYFQVRYLEDQDSFDADRGVNHERTTIRNEAGEEREADLWTGCFTPRELRLLAAAAGLDVDGGGPCGVWSVRPGDYRLRPPDLDHPEFLLVARR